MASVVLPLFRATLANIVLGQDSDAFAEYCDSGSSLMQHTLWLWKRYACSWSANTILEEVDGAVNSRR